MTRIAAVHGVLAPHRHAQREITDMVARDCLPAGADRRVLDRLHHSAAVRSRHTALPLDRYGGLDDFGAVNDVFIATAVDLGAEAITGALCAAGLSARDVDLLMFTSVTGIAAPSVDARLAGRLGLRPDVRRLPVFGLGCVAGAAGIARLHDYLLGRPDHVAVLLSVELCSLTFQRADTSAANLIATALFGDGAAAVVACGARRHTAAGATGPTVVASRSHLYPDTERLLGWDITASGFRVVLDPAVPDVVRKNLAADVDGFLSDHGLDRRDVTAWVSHAGGPKVLDAVEEALDLPDDALDVSRRSLAETGNLSSASVLHVLRDTLTAGRKPPSGTPGLLLAMGPGFCTELVLVRW
ncbi:3-oxoacyl-[acyl-carrier-protein] synthase III C-terminal domain-containing protein [Streptomyces ficellus]|uniref:3-oxoacyl-[acyl-carrier-protein] synthase III C-terminal domain-containing protein n=1 Tax=Streptomyces ficellus TaxID=1977088 RepID=A0ABT7Z6Q6_9ACTN|nr:3-oxoacyl-[acyl-carrier-protein] synthase III C-terminal domain-containing protein [Streptomyces ficellus]MDN3295184.1 3-oxoacyl-[acyl-carrier-protein] synthase III C-terminal domain-containing protein [Streptomyces ficellus]